jgi:hypothetical protein
MPLKPIRMTRPLVNNITNLTHRMNSLVPVKADAAEAEPWLRVVTVYQDSLTRHWAAELWAKVTPLVGRAGTRNQSWKMSELTDAGVFARAVEAASEADVLVVAVRGVGQLPLTLRVWIEDWLPHRAGRGGALVALVGLPARPDMMGPCTCEYLEAVARRAGMDFLPRERKLPEGPSASETRRKFAPGGGGAVPASRETEEADRNEIRGAAQGRRLWRS